MLRSLAQRVRCLFSGHPDTYILWGPWEIDGPETFRHCFECCARCDAVLHYSRLVPR